MNNITSIVETRENAIKEQDSRILDIKASCVILEQSYKLLDINKLPELIHLKIDIYCKIVEFRKIIKNGK